MKNTFSLPSPSYANYILFLNKPGTTSYGFGMRYLILSVSMNLLVLKENPRPHFVQRLFFLMDISLNIMYLVGICICYVFEL